MTERQEHILISLIREYIHAAEPVGSEVLVERYRLPYSSATVRLELADLEAAGFLTHPHTSAGRVPTCRGYRHFVDEHRKHYALPRTEVLRLQEDLREAHAHDSRLARRTTKILATLTGNLAIAGVSDREEFHEAGLPELLEEPEFAAAECIRDVSRLLDALDAHVSDLTRERMREARVYIGEENPYVRTHHVSMLVTTCDLPSGERALLALIGPTRMRYDRNLSILEHIARVLETPARSSHGGSP